MLLVSAVTASAAERYIIPIWGQYVRGANATYTGTIAMTNLSDATATVTVTKIVPILQRPCLEPCDAEKWTLPPYLTRVVSDQISVVLWHGNQLDLGAVEIESD